MDTKHSFSSHLTISHDGHLMGLDGKTVITSLNDKELPIQRFDYKNRFWNGVYPLTDKNEEIHYECYLYDYTIDRVYVIRNVFDVEDGFSEKLYFIDKNIVVEVV